VDRRDASSSSSRSTRGWRRCCWRSRPTSGGEVGVDTIVDKVLRKKAVPDRLPMELVKVIRGNLGSWVRQLRAWGFGDAPEEYLQRP
jgi:hypothetical protein